MKRLLIWVGCCSTQGNNEREGVVQDAVPLSSACLSAEASGASPRKRLNGCARDLCSLFYRLLYCHRESW